MTPPFKLHFILRGNLANNPSRRFCFRAPYSRRLGYQVRRAQSHRSHRQALPPPLLSLGGGHVPQRRQTTAFRLPLEMTHHEDFDGQLVRRRRGDGHCIVIGGMIGWVGVATVGLSVGLLIEVRTRGVRQIRIATGRRRRRRGGGRGSVGAIDRVGPLYSSLGTAHAWLYCFEVICWTRLLLVSLPCLCTPLLLQLLLLLQLIGQ
mmetsp:Transcript_23384/g.41566  ORF Transcript_23384/g.41566 Transcript_23384/m.41566 type:complete len:205 (+) Transcript_23384:478-1092(+)